MDHTEEQRILSFCTGSRGIEKGLVRAGIRVKPVSYVEIEAFQNFNLVAAMEAGLVDTAPIWTDLKTFPAQFFRNKIHGFTAGYPCQPFSLAGERKGIDDPRHLWPYILECIKTIRPVWCFFENVEGHLTMGYGEVYRSLRDLGYKVEADIYTAAEVGAPQQRKRLFILACSDIKFLWRCLANSSNKYGSISKESRNRQDKVTAPICCKVLADTYSTQLKSFRTYSKPVEKEYDRVRDNSTLSRWPTSPGSAQHNWEEPRTIESSVGCTINGYNFRTDLLRMYGNAVVEQTAELAFKDLLKKHLDNL